MRMIRGNQGKRKLSNWMFLVMASTMIASVLAPQGLFPTLDGDSQVFSKWLPAIGRLVELSYFPQSLLRLLVVTQWSIPFFVTAAILRLNYSGWKSLQKKQRNASLLVIYAMAAVAIWMLSFDGYSLKSYTLSGVVLRSVSTSRASLAVIGTYAALFFQYTFFCLIQLTVFQIIFQIEKTRES